MPSSNYLASSAPELPAEAFERAGLDQLNQTRFLLSPAQMVEAVKVYRQFELLAAIEVPSEAHALIDWGAFYAYDNISFDFGDLSPLLELHYGYWEEDPWWGFVTQQFCEATGKHLSEVPFDEMSEEESQQLTDFLDNPTQEVADSHPLLRHIPDIVSKATLIRAARQKAYFSNLLYHVPKPYCLTGDFATPDRLRTKVAGALHCWMFIVPDEHLSHHEFEDATINALSAVFVDSHETGTGTQHDIVAVVTGYHLHPLKGLEYMSDETFMVIMDAHSAHLNDVWKVVAGKFMPDNDMDCFQDMCEYFDGAFAIGIAAVTVNVATAYRGNKLSSFLFEAISSMTESGTFCDVLTPGDVELELDDLANDCFDHAPIFLFVLPIEGTPPPQDEPLIIEPGRAYNLTPRPYPIKVRDTQIELKRMKLTKYFESLNAGQDTFRVVTFNPWDYDIT